MRTQRGRGRRCRPSESDARVSATGDTPALAILDFGSRRLHRSTDGGTGQERSRSLQLSCAKAATRQCLAKRRVAVRLAVVSPTRR